MRHAHEAMMGSRRFKQVDVFSVQPFYGNPVAVVLDADGLGPDDMQRIAAWTNLSETTFVLTPTKQEADYRLRIFTPTTELPFAGHPTIGSAHAVLESGMVRPTSSRLIQECGAGLLPITIELEGGARRLFVTVPRATVSAVRATLFETIAATLDAKFSVQSPPLLIDIGPIWLVVQCERSEDIHAISPDMAALAKLSREVNATGVTVFSLTETGPCPVYVRAFAPACGVPEDPVCGSGNASVAAFLLHYDRLGLAGNPYRAQQGWEIGRDGMVHVRVDPGNRSIEIGGTAITCIDGVLPQNGS